MDLDRHSSVRSGRPRACARGVRTGANRWSASGPFPHIPATNHKPRHPERSEGSVVIWREGKQVLRLRLMATGCCACARGAIVATCAAPPQTAAVRSARAEKNPRIAPPRSARTRQGRKHADRGRLNAWTGGSM